MMFCYVVFVVVLELCFGMMEEGVLVLKASNFEHHVASNDERGLLVYFYAPWCRSCGELKPLYEEAALEVDILAKIDAEANAEVAEKYGIVAFPSLRFFRRGKVTDVGEAGLRDLPASLVEVVRRLSQDRCRIMDDEMEFIKVFEEKATGVRVAALFVPKKKKKKMWTEKSFLRFTEDFRYPVEFFLVRNSTWFASALSRAGVATTTTSPALLLLKPFDEKAATVSIDTKSSSWLQQWVETHMMPLVVPFSPTYMSMIFTGPLKMHAILAVNANDANFKTARDAFYKSAEAYRGKILHLMMFEPEDEEALAVWNFLDIKETPTVIVSDMTDASDGDKGIQTKLETATNADALIASLQSYSARAVARRHGVETKMADIMAEPKMQAMIRDKNMAQMFQMMGMPKKLATIYNSDDL